MHDVAHSNAASREVLGSWLPAGGCKPCKHSAAEFLGDDILECLSVKAEHQQRHQVGRERELLRTLDGSFME